MTDFNEILKDDDHLLREVVKAFSDASGGGPSQLLPVHLKEALTCGCDLTEQKLVRALRRFVDVCASGGLPSELAEFVTAANLIREKKKRGSCQIKETNKRDVR